MPWRRRHREEIVDEAFDAVCRQIELTEEAIAAMQKLRELDQIDGHDKDHDDE